MFSGYFRNPIARVFPAQDATGVTYYMQDEFTTDAAAPLSNPLTCEPGGTVVTSLTLTDPNNKLRKANSEIIQAAGGANGDTTIRSTQLTPFVAGRTYAIRVSGLPTSAAFTATFNATVAGRKGFNASPGAGYVGCILNSFNTANVYNIAYTAPRTFTHVWRENGTGFWIIGDELVWASSTAFYEAGVNASYLYIQQYYNNKTMNLDWVRGGDLGAPFTTTYGLATSYTASPSTGATATHDANFVSYLTWTPGAGETLVWDNRISDSNNYYRLSCSQAGGTIKFYRVVGGTPTELAAGKTQTWTAGTAYRISIHMRSGNIQTIVNVTTKHNIVGETHNLTATGAQISGFSTGENWEFYPATLTGAAKTELDRFFV